MRVGLLTDRINNKLERSNLINEHALNRGLVPLSVLKAWLRGCVVNQLGDAF